MNSHNAAILVVDDNEISRYATAKTLTHAGYTVLEAPSGQEALDVVTNKKPALVLLDLQLPDINGYDVCRAIKNNPQTQHTIVVYLTSLYKTTEHKAQGLESGADAYLTHPVEPLELISTIQALLRFQEHELIHEVEAQQWISLFNAINNAVLLLDPEGRILRYNRAFQEIIDKDESEILGSYCYKIVHSNSPTFIEGCPLVRAKASRKQETLDLQIGHTWFEIRVDPIITPEGELLGFAHVMNDITQRIALNRELEYRVAERTAQLQEANRQLEAFSHTVSHDLKAPIRRINEYLALLDPDLRNKAESPIQEALEDIERNTRLMAEIIEGLHRLAHIEGLAVSKERLDLSGMIRSVYENLTTSEQRERITFTADALPPCDGNPILMRQVWQNLISNAIKFSAHQPHPQITITGTETPERVEYCIRDNGVGFDMAYADKLFTMFTKLHSGKEYEGQGIGLALCKQILAKHGGTIRAESKVGEGASFYISLPKEPARSVV